MRDLYSDDYESVAVDGADRLVPDGIRKLAAATLFLALIATMALWSYRLGTRDATQVPVIKAAEGPSRVQPDDPGGLQAAHQGLEVNAVLAGRPAPMPQHLKPAPAAPAALAGEDAPQGELVLKAPAALTRQVLGEDTEMPTPQSESAADDVAAAALPLAPDDADTAPDADGNADIQRPRNRPANLAAARAKVTPVSVTKPPATDIVPKATATAAQKTASTPKPLVDAASAATKEVAGLATGTRLVQLGAFDSEAITRQAWAQLVARNGDLLGSKSLFVERTTANARVFYRLRVAGFQTADQTRALCEALRARGTACIPVTLQ
jgi:hypothetical protein